MTVAPIEADYLVVGAGASGMAFTDTLITESDADVVIVDRRHAPGGHWLDAYPFARLHQPSGCYGVASTPLGGGGPDLAGFDPDLGERATADEICGYYDRVMQHRLLASGRVRFFPSSDYLGGGRFRSRISGTEFDVTVRAKIVDATYLESSVPATSPPPFDVEDGARCIAVGELARLSEPPDAFVIVGAGKTAQDACLWLLAQGVDPDSIHWVRPRDPWLTPRRYIQPGAGAVTTFEGYVLQMEAAAAAETVTDLFVRLEAAGQLVRIDEDVVPTTYKGATVDSGELEQLRTIRRVIRLGHVRRAGRNEMILDEGSVSVPVGALYVHCAAPGLNPAPAVRVFDDHAIRLQAVRFGFQPFSAALIAFVEANRDDIEEKNGLCRPIPMPDAATDWVRTTGQTLDALYRWSRQPDIFQWIEGCRLNVVSGLMGSRYERMDPLRQRYVVAVGPAAAKLGAFMTG